MFLLRQPLAQDVDRVLAASRRLPLSYEPIGLTKQTGAGFNVDEQIAIVGSGEAAFARATTALREWRHFEVGWVKLFPKRASITPGTVVVVSVKHLGFWSLNGCRVVYSVGAQGVHISFGRYHDRVRRWRGSRIL